jgi:predicted amidohydrolase
VQAFLVQLDSVWEDKPASFRRVEALLADRTIPPGSLVVLPEMFATGFSMNLAATVETAPAMTEGFLRGLATRLHATVVGGLVREGKQGKGRNEAVVYDSAGELAARFCKLHPFSPAGELDRHERGENLVFFEWAGLVTAPFICYDLRFPEIFRRAARRGAELLVVIALWPSRRVEHWVTLLKARAIENQAWVIGVNRCGREGELPYPGRSVVVNPLGEIVADAGADETVVAAEIDPQAVRQWRLDFPALKDARTDLPA